MCCQCMLQIDKAKDPERWKAEAAARDDVVCISAITGEGMVEFYNVVEQKMKVRYPSEFH